MAKIIRRIVLGNNKLVILDLPDGFRITLEKVEDLWKGTLKGLSRQILDEEIKEDPIDVWRFVEPKRPNCAHRNLYIINVIE